MCFTLVTSRWWENGCTDGWDGSLRQKVETEGWDRILHSVYKNVFMEIDINVKWEWERESGDWVETRRRVGSNHFIKKTKKKYVNIYVYMYIYT